MSQPTSQTALRSFLYGGAAVLLIFDFFFLIKAVLTDNFVPIVPILAGIFTAAGLLFIVYAEQRAREADRRDHRRISRVSHQLEQPLYSLREDMENILQAKDIPAATRLQLRRMETKTLVLLDNIRDVFYMLRAQEEGIIKDVRIYNLCSVVSDAVASRNNFAKARNVELLHNFHCAKASVEIDRDMFLIALNHLIDNAITYTMTPSLVNVAVSKGNNRVRVIVQDRGIGITPADSSIIFQPFARGERAAKYDPDGIGVGLTLARHVIGQMNGKVKWKNKDRGMGAQFEIVLPLASDHN